MHAERKPDIRKSQYDLLTKLNKVLVRHIDRMGDGHEVITAIQAIATATIKSFPNPDHRVHYANHFMQALAKAALEENTQSPGTEAVQ